MQKTVLIEDVIEYQKPLADVCQKNGFEVVLTITPKWDTSADEIVWQILKVDPVLILLDHDFCDCRFTTGRCKCLNGYDIFERLGTLQSRVMCISGMNRDYITRERTFSFKDCLDELSVRKSFGTRLGWMFLKA